MRIVLDLQSVQSGSASAADIVALAGALVRRSGKHGVLLTLTNTWPETIEAIRDEFAAILRPDGIRVWHDPALGRGERPWLDAAQLVRAAFLANLAPDILLEPGRDAAPEAVATRINASFPVLALARARGAIAWARAGIDLDAGAPGAVAVEAERLADRLVAAFDEEMPVGPPEIHGMAKRRTLAFVSPLPPERTGIADYSDELLRELTRTYDVDVVVAQASVDSPWVIANCRVRDLAYFRAHADGYDRVLYHFGNSPFHQHMFDLIERVPGVVVMHEFYLGNVVQYREVHGFEHQALNRELYRSAGYGAVRERFAGGEIERIVAKYPLNLAVLSRAIAVIHHGIGCRDMATRWYGRAFTETWQHIPLLRQPADSGTREEARRTLGLADGAFVVCSFGMLGASKLNHRLLVAWCESALARDPTCLLVFVGANDQTAYGDKMLRAIRGSGFGDRIRITGWTDILTYRNYLRAADIAVQLRTDSRGESSAAALDCLNYGLSTIVNSGDSTRDLPDDAVVKLSEDFDDAELTGDLERLWRDDASRGGLAARGRAIVGTAHAPAACARLYVEAIEHAYRAGGRGAHHLAALLRDLASLPGLSLDHHDAMRLATAIGASVPRSVPYRQLLVDVSATARSDTKTGVQRVVRALVLALLNNPPPGYRVEPVSLSDEGGSWHYRYARGWTSRICGIADDWIADDAAEIVAGDEVLVADFTSGLAIAAGHGGVFDRLRADGVRLHFIVYDLLPVLMPQVFPPGGFEFHKWLALVGRVADGAICISRAVAGELRLWLESTDPCRKTPLAIGWFHLGADIENSSPTRGRPGGADATLARLRDRPTFLMVSTVEPRKGYLQALAAFTLLWERGVDVNLAIVGKEGWQGLPDASRRTIPETVMRLRAHPEAGRRLAWLDDASDEFLDEVYAASTCLIAASEGEGFGLPLIEAARHGLPILCRDLPVFREIAGDHSSYFSGLKPEDLADAVEHWLGLRREDRHPRSAGMPRQTWAKSAEQLLRAILPDR
jgi:glycosyltransferase involved in cell wall biosynthesis